MASDLPQISDEDVQMVAEVISEALDSEGYGYWINTTPEPKLAHPVLERLVASGWRPEVEVLRPVTWQEPGELPAAFHQHRCGAVEWWPMEGADSGGCDACESGSDDPRDWRMLYAADWPATALEQAQPLLAAGSEVDSLEPVESEGTQR